jgi:simple sugar transport system permease protein
MTIVFGIISIFVFLGLLSLGGHDFDSSEIYEIAIKGVLSDSWSVSTILFWSVPLMLTGLSVAIAFKAGLFNIGGQGQLMIGGGFAAIWGAAIVPESELWSQFNNNPWFMIPTTLFAGILGGAIWGFIPGFLKAKTGAHEVITTILMNLIAISIINYWFVAPAHSPYVDTTIGPDAYGQSNPISKSARIPSLAGNPTIKKILNYFDWSINQSLNFSIILVILVIILSHILIYKMNFGYKIRAVGLNPVAAKTSGIRSDRVTIIAMTISGSLAGLAGTLIVMGVPTYRYVAGMESTFGFDGIAVALIGANSPIGVAFAALLFGFLRESGQTLERNTELPADLIIAFQGFVILFTASPLIAKRLIKFVKGWKIPEKLAPIKQRMVQMKQKIVKRIQNWRGIQEEDGST